MVTEYDDELVEENMKYQKEVDELQETIQQMEDQVKLEEMQVKQQLEVNANKREIIQLL